MAEMKYLNTRVQLKYDTLAEWQEKNPILLAGELAIVSLGSSHTSTAPDNGTHPILFKVGPGAFNSLPFASALAADVYNWAKQDSLFVDGTEATTTTSGDKTYTGNAYTSVEWDSMLNGGKGGLKLIKGTQFATKTELDAALEAFGGDLDAITDNNTKYAFEIPTSGDHAGQLAVTETNYVNGEVNGSSTTTYYDFLTSGEIEEILTNYYTKAEVDGLIQGVEAKIPTELGVMSVGGKEAIKTAGDKNVEVSLALDNSGNVTLSQSTNGLKADINIPEYSIVKDITSEYAATYHLTKDGINVGAAINIPKDMVVESGEVKELESGIWGDAGTYIVITLANATDDKLYINVGDLIEYVTGNTASDGIITTTVDGNNVLTATINDGTITLAKLDTNIQASLAKADSALQEHQDISGKADKVSGATANNFAGLDAEGNLIDSGKKASDFAPAGDYALRSELPTVNDGNFTVSGTGALTGTGSMTANQAGDTTVELDIAAKGVTTEKIADQAIGAEQTKAYQATEPQKAEDITSEEVWVFYCGTASILI